MLYCLKNKQRFFSSFFYVRMKRGWVNTTRLLCARGSGQYRDDTRQELYLNLSVDMPNGMNKITVFFRVQNACTIITFSEVCRHTTISNNLYRLTARHRSNFSVVALSRQIYSITHIDKYCTVSDPNIVHGWLDPLETIFEILLCT